MKIAALQTVSGTSVAANLEAAGVLLAQAAPAGECGTRYDKVHLFRFDNGREQYDESRVIEAGTAPQAFTLPSRDGHGWRVGLSVCYDLRFPELYRGLGADLLLVPSAFTYP